MTCALGDVLWKSRYYYSNCSHFNAYLSPNPTSSTEYGIKYYVLECLGPGLPLAGLYFVKFSELLNFLQSKLFTGVHSTKNHQLLRILYDTRPTHTAKLNDLALPTQRSFEIPLQHGTRASVQLLLPPSWREELRDAAFPVLVEV